MTQQPSRSSWCRTRAGHVGLAALALLLAAACEGQPEAVPPVEAADTLQAEEAAAPAEPVAALETVEEEAEPSAFLHAPHKTLECSRCHRSIPGHTDHGQAACTDCHPTPARFASVAVPTRAECLSCHHDPARDMGCTECHERSGLYSGNTAVTLELPVWAAPRTRRLLFDHTTHRGRSCDTCHPSRPAYTPSRDCGACHGPHHTMEARCSSCHVAPDDPSIHAGDAHRACDAAGCHDAGVIAALPWERATCLTCHEAQVRHEAPRRCLDCHPVTAGAGMPGGRP